MNILVGIVITAIFYYLTADLIRKYSTAFYIGSYALIAGMILLYGRGLDQNLPSAIAYLAALFQRGVIATASFIIVMYLGVVIKHNAVTKRLLQIRGEMSIIACFMALTHNIIFGVQYFVAFFQGRGMMPLQVQMATVVSMILIALMIPLGITSFKSVRRKMNSKSWKKLQRLAYPFYFLLYFHVMLLFSMNVQKNLLSITIYTLIFVAYAILRLQKYFYMRGQRNKKA